MRTIHDVNGLLAVNIFNEKTIAELTYTKIMVENVTIMWHIINVKTPSDGKRLNDDDRLPVTEIDDPRLAFLMEIGECFKSMESKYTHRVRSLTVDTRTALHMTLHGLVDMAKMFLVEKNILYILFGHFQSDPIEGEFDVYRQDSWGNYYICYEQILSSLTLRRIKLFDRLEVPYSNDHFKDECCLADLSEKEINLLDNIPSADNLSEHDIILY